MKSLRKQKCRTRSAVIELLPLSTNTCFVFYVYYCNNSTRACQYFCHKNFSLAHISRPYVSGNYPRHCKKNRVFLLHSLETRFFYIMYDAIECMISSCCEKFKYVVILCNKKLWSFIRSLFYFHRIVTKSVSLHCSKNILMWDKM